MPRGKIYNLDQLTQQMGHEVVRFPPYHCQYNPIELILAQFKDRVAEKNSTFKIADVEAFNHKETYAVTADDWAKCGEHCVKIQEDFYKAGLRDEILESIILKIYTDDNS
jgi:transposase